ncbi:PaaX family transcriptional regulator C-terminal domain-containing protein [Roseobacter ponti]|uniref:PaaX family transcriptional regulator n=1 Tax=Roseobacter ponti TaxID=1891787 RepID=A0A858SQ21_9RHOB|nr:PaaX family transcriptional regulator C-terminal domain-containing protein [Roseobacter ponti]QJF49793.1 PaaX family transcriptional regulator [Roseobacter ponti]
MQSETFTTHARALTGPGGQRVWSLIVSVFGDLAQEKGATIPGPALSKIMAAMDVRPEATRVALHRLRRDGWITSRKTGRTSLHSLTAHGRSETVAASARIYASPDSIPREWQIILAPEDTSETALRAMGYTPLMAGVLIAARGALVPADAALLQGETLPDRLRHAVAPAPLCAEYAALFETLRRVRSDLPELIQLPPVQRAVLRCLIVHNWRRLVLKHSDLPEAVFPQGWRGHECHRLVFDLLQALPRPNGTDTWS